MAITVSDILSAREKFSDLNKVYDVTVNAFVESLLENARYEANPGPFAERRYKYQADEAMRCAVRLLSVYRQNVPNYVPNDQDRLTVTNHMIERALAKVGPEERHKEFCREVGILLDAGTGTPEANDTVLTQPTQ
jgi:hypothetical protein